MRALLLILALLLAAPAPQALAQGARGTVSAEEMELQRALQGGIIAGRVSIPDQQAGNLVQPAGQGWRAFHNRTLYTVGAVALCGIVLGLWLFWSIRGRIRIDAGPSGTTMRRFNLLERSNHWMTASSFIILMLSGLNLTFGRFFVAPLLGDEAFAALSGWGKLAHNYVSFAFALGIIVMFLLWVKDNIPNRGDIAWLKAGGGLFARNHPPAERFNAGQKGVFWITVLGGALVAATGYILMFPFTVTDIAGQQLSHMVHGVLSMLMIAAILAHIYIGSVGMEGAIDAMSSGDVDVNWAREHHSLWVDKEFAKANRSVAAE
jgi:formate dehydrogenase subunit gamma